MSLGPAFNLRSGNPFRKSTINYRENENENDNESDEMNDNDNSDNHNYTSKKYATMNALSSLSI